MNGSTLSFFPMAGWGLEMMMIRYLNFTSTFHRAQKKSRLQIDEEKLSSCSPFCSSSWFLHFRSRWMKKCNFTFSLYFFFFFSSPWKCYVIFILFEIFSLSLSGKVILRPLLFSPHQNVDDSTELFYLVDSLKRIKGNSSEISLRASK